MGNRISLDMFLQKSDLERMLVIGERDEELDNFTRAMITGIDEFIANSDFDRDYMVGITQVFENGAFQVSAFPPEDLTRETVQ